MSRTQRSSHTALIVAFAVVIAIWIVAQVVARMRAERVDAAVSDIVDNALASIRLVERLGIDVMRERVLVDSHIFQPDEATMGRIENEIGATRRDYELASLAYAKLATFPREREAWDRLQGDVAATRAPIAEALAASRKNDDAVAAARVQALEPRFAAIDADVEDLVRINGDEAKRVQGEVARAQSRGTLFEVLIGLAAVAMTLAIAFRATRDVAEKQRRLDEHAAALADLNGELDAFSGRVAHDLRGPLGTARLAVAALAKASPEHEGLADILRRSIARMDALIGDLLTLSRLGSTPSEARADVRGAIGAVEPELVRRVEDVDGSLRIDVQAAQVRCDAGLLGEAVWNLGENAVKYRRESAKLDLAIVGRTTRDGYELSISDNGVGMSEEDAAHVFEPFFRARTTRAKPGTGLGLAIVKRVVDASGGRVSVRSTPGAGTTVVLALRLAT